MQVDLTPNFHQIDSFPNFEKFLSRLYMLTSVQFLRRHLNCGFGKTLSDINKEHVHCVDLT